MVDIDKSKEELITELQHLRHETIELRKAETIFKDILEKNPMSIQILDAEGYTIQTNRAHTKLFGAKPPSDYSIFKDTQLLKQGFDKLFERIKKGEVVYFPDSYFNVHDVDPSFPDSPAWIKAIGFTISDFNGIPEKVVLMHEDITARKQAEAMLQDIIDNNPLSIQIVDKDGFTLHGNPAYKLLFGAVPPPDFSIFNDLQNKGLSECIRRVKLGEVINLPDLYYNANDSVAEAPDIPLWIRAVLFPLKNSNGKPERFVFMHENITESKIAKEELIKAKDRAEQSDRLKSAFLANMSHEIRTPMNGILGFAELLKEPELTGEEQQEFIKIIEKSGARMLNIINDIIDISKIEAGLMKVEIKNSNINDQIEYIYAFFKPEVESKGLKISFKNGLSANEATLLTDREKLYAILTNLVKNSIKYTLNGSIEFGYEKKGKFVEFFVKDTGIGIPKDRQDAIFERFIQADIEDTSAFQGSGLGLSISKAYVEMLGGKMWVESEVGTGSVFYFTIPYTQEHKVKIESKTDSESGGKENAITNLKILVAEDDEISERLISIELKKFSKEILRVRTGVGAIEMCRRINDIDLIIMDIQMPGINGYEATKEIRKFNKDVVIIAQTAFALSGDREKAIESGCNDYISKPIIRDQLYALIHKYFSNGAHL